MQVLAANINMDSFLLNLLHNVATIFMHSLHIFQSHWGPKFDWTIATLVFCSFWLLSSRFTGVVWVFAIVSRFDCWTDGRMFDSKVLEFMFNSVNSKSQGLEAAKQSQVEAFKTLPNITLSIMVSIFHHVVPEIIWFDQMQNCLSLSYAVFVFNREKKIILGSPSNLA